MKLFSLKNFSALILLILASCGQQDEAPSGLQVDIDYYQLDNGLRVVLAPENSVPTITVAVYYNVGFRIEPQERTGFAHLFEHLMFEGTPNMPEGEFAKFINGSGGAYNGSTRFDFTNYYEVLPTHQLEPLLWVEAPRSQRAVGGAVSLLAPPGPAGAAPCEQPRDAGDWSRCPSVRSPWVGNRQGRPDRGTVTRGQLDARAHQV